MWTLLVVCFCWVARCAVGHGKQSRGYSLHFQKQNSVASIKGGGLNWTEPGLGGLQGNFTISYWYKSENNVNSAVHFSFGGLSSFMQSGHSYAWFQAPPYFFGMDWHFTREEPYGNWHFRTIVCKEGDITLYINGTKALVRPWASWGYRPYDFKADDTTFMFGNSFVDFKFPFAESAKQKLSNDGPSEEKQYAFYSPFLGKIDDFTFWSRVLNETEIQATMDRPLDIANVTSDIVFAYSFDQLDCSQEATSPTHHTCDAKANGTIKNYGVSGSNYDLILGKVVVNSAGDTLNKSFIFDEENSNDRRYAINVPNFAVDVPRGGSTNTYQLQVPTAILTLKGSSSTINFTGVGLLKQVKSLPEVGELIRMSTKSSLELNEDISDETVLIFNAPTGDFEPITFSLDMLDHNNVPGVHEVHLLPYVRPQLDFGAPLEPVHGRRNVLEQGVDVTYYILGSSIRAPLKQLAYSSYGDELDIRLVSEPPPKYALDIAVLQYAERASQQRSIEKAPLTPGFVFDRNRDYGLHFQQAEQNGNFKIVLEFFSPSSGLSSDPLTIDARVVGVTHRLKANVTYQIPALNESDTTGVHFTAMPGMDSETQKSGLLIGITSLPRKGKLYKRSPDSSRWVPVNQTYSELSQTGNLVKEYVSGIRKVSRFNTTRGESDGGEDYWVAYHPLHLIGPSTCQADLELTNSCDGQRPPQELKAKGTLLLVNIYSAGSPFANASMPPLRMPGRVVNETTAGLLTVEMLTTYKHVGQDIVQCMMHRGDQIKSNLKHPEDCDTSKVLSKGPFLIHNVDLTNVQEVQDPKHRYWQVEWEDGRDETTAVYDTYIMDREVHNKSSVMFGAEYIFSHNAWDTYYNPTSRIPYTDFVEIEFNTSVYPFAVEIGSARRGGGVVTINALSPENNWVTLYENRVDCNAKLAQSESEYFVFKPKICTQNFKTNILRLHVDSHDEQKGIRLPQFDFVRLVGFDDMPNGLLHFGTNLLKYVPDPNQFGEDTFTMEAWNCGGDDRRSSGRTEYSVDILPLNDIPWLESNELTRMRCLRNSSLVKKTVTLNFRDVDEDDLEISLLGLDHDYLPVYFEQNGDVLSYGTRLEATKMAPDMHSLELTISLDCKDPRIVMARLEATLSIADGTVESYGNLTFLVFKEDMGLATSAKAFAYAFVGINLSFSLLFLIWVVVNRHAPLVVAAQFEMLVLIILGTIVSTSTILARTQDDGIDGEAGPMADAACKAIPWLYTSGFMITFTPLYVKTAKIAKIFDVRTKTAEMKGVMSRKHAFRKIAMLWLVDIIICSVWAGSSPLSFERQTIKADLDNPEIIIQSIGTCSSDHTITFGAIIAVYHLLLLALVGYYCVKTKNIHDAFSEGKYIAIAIGSSFQVLLFSLPIMVMISENPNANQQLFIVSGIIWLNDFTVLVCLCGPKIYMFYYGISATGGSGFTQIENMMSKHTGTRLSVSRNMKNTPESALATPSEMSTSVAEDLNRRGIFVESTILEQ